ncbi:MAG: glycosyltransferase family 1 protein [Pedosphaera sp.]|nr:glycosyltransferase family 1 protein [Pedosphaera sp.]
MKLGVLTSHPIQYQAPWFRALAKALELQVFICHQQSAAEQGRAGFGVAFDWDVDLLAGYQHRFLKNVSARPGVNHFSGCDTPEINEILKGQLTPHSKLRTPHFDAFIVSGWHLKAYWQAARACRRAGVPVLVRGDSQLHTPRSRLKRWAKEILYRPLLRQFDGFLVVGQRNREYLAHYGVPERKFFFAPHFVDNEWFGGKAAEGRRQKAEGRKEWGADERTVVALFVGKFQAIKRPQDILHALGKLRGSDVKVMAVFVGAGEMEAALRERAATLGVSARFEGFKNQSELPRYYAAADVLVLPSESETWGLVVNEAMACGLPAIVSDAVGCAPDLIEPGRTGFTFPVGDVERLADCLGAVEKLRRAGHDFSAALRAKAAVYSVEAAVAGTVAAVKSFGPGNFAVGKPKAVAR